MVRYLLQETAMKTFQFLLAIAVAGAVTSSVQAATDLQRVTAPSTTPSAISSLQMLAAAPLPQAVAPAVPTFQYPVLMDWAPAQSSPLAAVDADMDTPNLTLLNLPLADSASHSDSTGKVKTELAGKYEVAKSIAEPASELLMLVALGALAIAVRRQLPT